MFSFETEFSTPAERWNLKNPNWPRFTEFLETEISKIKNHETISINQLTDTITSLIINTGNNW
jgi:hypothetical protein